MDQNRREELLEVMEYVRLEPVRENTPILQTATERLEGAEICGDRRDLVGRQRRYLANHMAEIPGERNLEKAYTKEEKIEG